MKEDLKMVGNDLTVSNTVFMIGYIVGMVPNNLMLLCVPPRIWLSFCTFAWGLLTLGMYKVTSFKHICALLSQRRRWINSTVHNLFELVLIRDLCGTFCFSMQFVIGIELVGTLVLPLAICFTIYVIIVAIVSKPTPTMTLILLAIILGLPGLIVVITATRWSYLMWMAIYIIALPIWNGLLPTYAYWKFDDFSWGDTRTIAGGNKGAHDDVEGEFDHSKIKMRTWREFEREDKLNRLATDEESNSRMF